MDIYGLSVFAVMLAAIPGWLSDLISSPNGQMVIEYYPHILISMGLGALLGFERRRKHKVAGVRTHMVVSVSACVIALCGVVVARESGVGDPSRLAAQVLAGLGFVGAGVILRQGLKTSGITTAATILFSAGIGIACGFGFFGLATFTTVVTIIGMILTYRLFPSNDTGGYSLKIICPLVKFDEVRKLFGANNRVDSLQKLGDKLEFRLHTELNSHQLDALLQQLVKNEDVISVDVLDELSTGE